MALSVLTASTSEPVNASQALDHVRGEAEDGSLVGALVSAATGYCETFTRRAFTKTQLRQSDDRWPSGSILELDRPLFDGGSTNVTLSYLAEGGSTYTTVASTSYHVDAEAEPGRIVLKSGVSWPSVTLETANSVRVDYWAGYGSTATPVNVVPDEVKQAILLLTGHWYENRESVVVGTVQAEVAQSLKALLWSVRV